MPGPGSFQHRRFPVNAVVTAVACALLAISQSANVYTFWQGSRNPGTWRLALALMLPTWAVMALCWPLFMWLARTYTFAPQNRARSAAVHVAAGLVFAFVHNTSLTVIYTFVLAPEAPALKGFGSNYRTTLAYLFYQDVLAYGALLGVFLLGLLTRRANQSGAMVGMAAGFATTLYLWLRTIVPLPWPAGMPNVPWTWYVAIGCTVTFVVGYATSAIFGDASARADEDHA